MLTDFAVVATNFSDNDEPLGLQCDLLVAKLKRCWTPRNHLGVRLRSLMDIII